jgi:lysophospholipase L1-like esterase
MARLPGARRAGLFGPMPQVSGLQLPDEILYRFAMSVRVKSFLYSFLFVLVSLWVSLWLVEGLARLYFHGTIFAPSADGQAQQLHATRGSALPPGKTLSMYQLAHAETATINSRGFRGAEVGDHPPAGKTRILLLSDSNGFGSGVADNETLAVQLQRSLGDDAFEVLNFSVPAYSNVQELLWLREQGLALHPDVVLFGFTPDNDIQTNYQPLQAVYQSSSKRPYGRIGKAGALEIDNSFMRAHAESAQKPRPLNVLRDILFGRIVQRLADQAWERTTGGRKNDPNIWIGWPYLAAFSETQGTMKVNEYQKLWEDAWAVTRSVILAMRAETERSGARFLVFSHVAKIDGEPQYLGALQQAYPGLTFDAGKAERELRAFADANGIAMVSASSQVRSQGGLYFGIDDNHMNARGYGVVAGALAEGLRRQGLLPAK